jgi:hypothetical protein
MREFLRANRNALILGAMSIVTAALLLFEG